MIVELNTSRVFNTVAAAIIIGLLSFMAHKTIYSVSQDEVKVIFTDQVAPILAQLGNMKDRINRMDQNLQNIDDQLRNNETTLGKILDSVEK